MDQNYKKCTWNEITEVDMIIIYVHFEQSSILEHISRDNLWEFIVIKNIVTPIRHVVKCLNNISMDSESEIRIASNFNSWLGFSKDFSMKWNAGF